ncbi:LysR family transcriptional regulator, partial [Rhizobium ruizarguesonis]
VFDCALKARSHFYLVRPRYRKSEAVEKLQDWLRSKVQA